MSNRSLRVLLRATLPVTLMACVLAACAPSPQAEEPAPQAADAVSPAAPPTSEGPAVSKPDADDTPAPAQMPPPEDTPAAPGQPTPEPPPTEPSPTATPTVAADEPPLESMLSARAPAKLGVPVDLKYSFDSEPLVNQPVTLHLAAVPRVAGTHLAVSLKTADGIRVASGGHLMVQKANAKGAYRQQFSLTRQASVPELRVLVTMDLPEGSAFGFFSIPFEPGKKSQKQDSVKQP